MLKNNRLYNWFIEIVKKIKIHLMLFYYHPYDFFFLWNTVITAHYYKIKVKFKIFFSDSYYSLKKWKVCLRYRLKFYLYSRWYILASVFIILYLLLSFTDLAFDPANAEDLYKYVLYKNESREWKAQVFIHAMTFLVVSIPLTILFLFSQNAEECLVIDLWAFYLGTCCISQYRFRHYWEILFGYLGSQVWITLIVLHLATYFTAHLSDWEVDFLEGEEEDEEEEFMLQEEVDLPEWERTLMEPWGELDTNIYVLALQKGFENGALTRLDHAMYCANWDFEEQEDEMFFAVAREENISSIDENIKIPDEELKHIKYDKATYYVRKVYPFLFDMSGDGLDEHDYSEEDYEAMSLHFIEWNLTHNTFIDYIDSFHKDYNLDIDENTTDDEKYESEFKYTEDLDLAFSKDKPLPREAKLKKMWITLNYSMDDLDGRLHRSIKKFVNHETAKCLFTYDSLAFTKSVTPKTKNELKRHNVKYTQDDWSNFNEATDLQKNLVYDLKRMQRRNSLHDKLWKRYYKFNATHPKIGKFLLLPLWHQISENFKKHDKNIKVPLIKVDTSKREYSFSSRLFNYRKEKIKRYFIRFKIYRLKFKLFIKRIFKIKRIYYIVSNLLLRFFLWLKRKIVIHVFYKWNLFFHNVWKDWSFAPDFWYDVRVDISNNVRLVLFDVNTFKSISFDLYELFYTLIKAIIYLILDLEPKEIYYSGPYSFYNPYYNKNLFRRKVKLKASATFISYTMIKDKINEERRWKKLQAKFRGKIHTLDNKKFFLKLVSKKF